MKHIKLFEAFKLPDRNPDSLVANCFSDINDEFGNHISWRIYSYSGKITTQLTIKQILRKAEIEDFCEDYILPGIGRMRDEGFELIPKNKPGMFMKFMTDSEGIYYKGVNIRLDGGETDFYFEFKNELK